MGTSNGWFTPSNSNDETTMIPIIAERSDTKPKARKRTARRLHVVPTFATLIWIGLLTYIGWRLIG